VGSLRPALPVVLFLLLVHVYLRVVFVFLWRGVVVPDRREGDGDGNDDAEW
jgi:hypothetical protein